MYIHTVHVKMDTSKPRNKQIMSIKKKKKKYINQLDQG